MRRMPGRLVIVAILALIAVVFGGLGLSGRWPAWDSNILTFVAWCASILLLFVLGLWLPLRARGARWRAALWNLLLAAAAIVLGVLANVAVYRHDAHIDASSEGINSPPPQLAAVLGSLGSDVSLTYFFNADDPNALEAKELLTIAARQNAHLRFRAVDLDKEPALAREFGVRAYNSAIAEAGGRRVVVDNSVDLAQMAYALLRVLKQGADVVCLVTGHGEGAPADSAHVHYSHVETMQGHDVPGAGDVLQGDPDGLDKLQLAMTTLGYTVRKIVPATAPAIPADCTVVAEIGPRQPWAPSEAKLLGDYLTGGGHLLAMLDPEYPISSEFADLLGRVGLSLPPATVIDPLNHYGADADKLAVPYYPPHPITTRLALTIFPNARPIRLEKPPTGVRATILAASSNDSYPRPNATVAQAAAGGGATAAKGPQIIAAALEGTWPHAPASGATKPFRMVLTGDSNFASNAYFGYVSNGDLALRMVRWLAGDKAMAPVRPQTLSLQEIALTREQMRITFILVELLLPLSIALLGVLVWWRRR